MRGISGLGLMCLVMATSGCMLDADGMRGFENCNQLRKYMNGTDVGSLLGAANFSSLSMEEVLVAELGEGGPVPGGEGDGVLDDPWDGAEVWTDTNLQDAGVDEADLVKTDGEFIYAISGGKLVISRGWPLENAQQIATVAVDGDAHGLYYYDATVVVISTLLPDETPDPASDADPWTEDAGWRDSDAVGVTVVDVLDPDRPVILRETYATGALRETRRIGDLLYVVATEDVDPNAPSEGTAKASDRLSKAIDYLPVRFDNILSSAGAWDVVSEPACDCEDVYAPEGGADSIVTTVLVLDLADPTSEFTGGGIVGPADVVYSSPTSLYIANAEQVEQGSDIEFIEPVWKTALHKFDLTSESPEWIASTRVKGLIPDRFGLSEHNEVMRIATVDLETMSSGITTLETQGGVFIELDHLGDLAPGEDLTAARFVGDLGYLVTYVVEKGDPLFTFDLSNPEDLILGGELHIPGWSDYLHPMADPGKLFAVGMDQEWDGDWVLSASIFDVSDLSDPRLKDRLLLDAGGSEASVDHHAFTYDPDTGYVAIPSTDASGDTVLEILKADTAITHVGSVDQPDSWGDPTCIPIRRSIMMDGEKVWAYSAGGLKAVDLADPSLVEAKFQFTDVDPCL